VFRRHFAGNLKEASNLDLQAIFAGVCPRTYYLPPKRPANLNMAVSTRFRDLFCRNRLMLVVLCPVFFATAMLLLMGMPILEQYSAGRYSVGFADGYDIIAKNVAYGNGYRWRADLSETMIREPGYPLLLAATFKIAGDSIEAARLLNLLLTVGIVVMLMALAKRMTSDPRVPVVAALFFLVHPGTLIAEARGGEEILFIFAGFGFMLALDWAMQKDDLWRYLLAGVAFGLVIEVRSTPIGFPVLLLPCALFAASGMRERLRAAIRVAIIVIGMSVVMVPWVVRNYQLVHEFVPLSSLGGVALQEGLYMCRNVTFGVDLYPVGRAAGRERGELARELGMRFEGVEYFQMFYNARDEVAFDRILNQTTMREYTSNPRLLGECLGKNFFNFWFLGKTWNITKLNMLVQAPLLALVFLGLWIVWRLGELRKMGVLLIYVSSIVILHLLVVAEARYSIPVLAFLAIPAGVAVTFIWDKVRKSRAQSSSPTPLPKDSVPIS
jgi:4-amino-4-deoxy-L-arabinose transferase-like glycosyltransferase